MKSRSELGKLYQAHHKTGYGAEIGVKEGWNSKNISKYWTGHTYLIDTWSASDLERMQVLINMHGRPCSIIQYDSVRASRLFNQAHLDWVYIDGGHEYEQVKADHWAYYHVVRKGGIISGHDYSPDFPGVCRLVDELIAEGHEIQFTTDDIYNGVPYQTWWYVR